jgi:hypothetical protein
MRRSHYIVLILLLIAQTSFGQVYQNMAQPGYKFARARFDSVLTIPSGLGSLKNISGGRDTGQIRFNLSDSSVYVWNGRAWIKPVGGGGGGDTTGIGDLYIRNTTTQENKRFNVKGGRLDTLYASTSAGGRVVSNSGTIAAEWGLGGGSNFDFYGFAGYNANRASSYTVRSFTDKNYVDSIAALKQNLVTLTTTGTSGAATFNQSTGALNIPQYAGGGGSQTLQQVLTTGSTLTQSNNTNNGGFAQTSSNGKNIFDSIAIKSSAKVIDSIWFDGTSITTGVGVTSSSYRFTTLVSNKLNSIEINKGENSAQMYVQGINANHMGAIPIYSASKYKWMILEWGTNDMQLGVTDTATYAAAYLRYLDTAIARSWPVSNIVVLSPSWVDSSVSGAALTPRMTAFNICTKNIALRRGTKYIDIYSLQLQRGKQILLSDGIHPSNSGSSLSYLTPIVELLTDSVENEGQSIAINGNIELQNLKLRVKNIANDKTVPIGLDSSGNVVRYDNAGLIANGEAMLQPQSASINISGRALIGNATSPTAVEKLQVNGTLKASYGRFTASGPSGLLGASTEIGFTSNEGYLYAYDRTAATTKALNINFLGGIVKVGGGGGSDAALSAPTIQAATGKFSGALTAITGAGVEIATFSGGGYIGAYNRPSTAMDLYMQGLGGKILFGSLSIVGTNTFQFAGTGHFTSSLNIGATAAPTATLQTTSFATAYTASGVNISATIAHNVIDLTATGLTATLPTAVGITGREYTIKLTAVGTGTVATTSSQTIDGSTTYSLLAQYKYVTVKSTGANWIIIANN